MRGPHHLVVTPPVAIKDIASPPAYPEGRPAIIGLFPTRNELPSFKSASEAGPSTPAATGGFVR